ncbi:MAG: LysM peptidoglycan-binding domain-containing protein [Myxococcales bacterium FL481]|nr:MAG: LysM peptidoglycan-binding domain-containing protein [Myxococcales bacterium FL481]
MCDDSPGDVQRGQHRQPMFPVDLASVQRMVCSPQDFHGRRAETAARSHNKTGSAHLDAQFCHHAPSKSPYACYHCVVLILGKRGRGTLGRRLVRVFSRHYPRARAVARPLGICSGLLVTSTCLSAPPQPIATHDAPQAPREDLEPEVTPSAEPVSEPEPESGLDAAEISDGFVVDDDGWIHFDYNYQPPQPPEPRIVTYAAMSGEDLTSIATRFGTTEAAIIERNGLEPELVTLESPRKLEILATEFQAPRLHFRYRVRAEETWEDVATAFDVPLDTLKAFNGQRPRTLRKGHRIKIWVDSAIPKYGESLEHPPSLDFEVPKWGQSLGGVKWGRLKNGIELPDSPLYTKRQPKTSWGSTHAITVIMRSIAVFRHETGFEGELLLGSISKKRGGKFPPHRSHRSGRDVDVGLPAFPGFPEGTRARAGRVDWGATWALLQSFIRSGEIRYIFLSYGLQRRLHEAAVQMGASDEELDELIQWPHGRDSTRGVIRDAHGHDTHVHIRIGCGPNEPKCYDPQ